MERPINNISDEGVLLSSEDLLRAVLARVLIEHLGEDAEQALPERLQAALWHLSSVEGPDPIE